MPALLPSPYRVRKPPAGSQIDWSHPLAEGLLRSWDGLEGTGGITADSVGISPFTFTSATWVASNAAFGMVWNFNGSTSLLSAPSFTTFTTETLTWEGWFRTSQSITGTNPFIVGRSNVNSTQGVTLFLRATSGVLGAQVFNSGSAIIDVAGSGAALNDGRWHHYAITVNLSSRAEIFTDGVSTGTGTGVAWGGFGAWPTRIGISSDAFWGKFNGQHALFRWHRGILSATIIQGLYSEPFAMLRGPDAWRRYL